MLENLDMANILFLDIETVSGKASYDELSDTFKSLWKLKSRSVLRKYDVPIEEDEAAAAYEDRAAIFAEFGKIVCISVGIIIKDKKTQELTLRLKSFASDDEAELLGDFIEMVAQYYNDPFKYFFCGHNLKEFDIPYICRRMVVNQLKMPKILDIAGKKPWENKQMLDTLELWRFGDFKNFTSLKMLTALFDIPSPKDDIDGSEVGRVYWKENDLARIARYCEKDVLAVVQLLLKYRGQELLPQEQIVFVT